MTLGLQSIVWMIRPRYRPAQLLIALDFVGAGSTFIVALVGLFTGMAFTVSTIVGFRQFGAEGMVGGVVALALARELAPVLAAVVVTARAGSTMASELGTMRVTEQIDAITTMGVSPIQYLVSPRVIATTLMMPLLATCFGVAGQTGSYVMAVLWQGIDLPARFSTSASSSARPTFAGSFRQERRLRLRRQRRRAARSGFYATGGARGGVGEATATGRRFASISWRSSRSTTS